MLMCALKTAMIPLLWSLRGSAVYSRRRSALGLVKLRSLWGDTAMPGGLHARLCHAFLVNFML